MPPSWGQPSEPLGYASTPLHTSSRLEPFAPPMPTPAMLVPVAAIPAEESTNSHRSSGGGSARMQAAPVHIRLYQEKDERRRRLEEARIRRLEQEEEDIRFSAQLAMGREPSPGRARSPEPPVSAVRGQAQHSGRTAPPFEATPPRVPPPLPQRSASASSLGSIHTQGRRGGGSGAALGGGAAPRVGACVGGSACGGACASRGRVQRPVQGGGGAAGGLPGGSCVVGSSAAVGYPSSPAVPRGQVSQLSPQRHAGEHVGHLHDGPGYASSIASEIGAHGLQSIPSVTILGHEDSTCGEPQLPEDGHSLRQLVQSQQQRIEFLETMHQQALRHLRRSREELSQVQQQRFREVDKLLGLEQLISEMQVMRFDAHPQMQLRWEEWMQRSRSILEVDA